jgi:sugar O-acyltransferase (sialic acid O-acetyltransferase NeuD family)
MADRFRSLDLVILGAGGFARQAVWLADRVGFRVVAMLDELADSPSEYQGIPIVRDLGALGASREVAVVSAVGSPDLRRRWAAALGEGHVFTQLHDPAALIAPNATMGAGSSVFAGSVCSTHSRIGDHTIIGFNCLVSHDVAVGAFSHLAGGVVLNGGACVGNGCLVGAGAVVLPGVRIGDGAVVGAGAVVSRDVPAGTTVASPPARRVPSGSHGD